MTTVKICGLRDPASLEAALDAGADMVGFVVFAPSPRHVSLATAHALARQVGGRAQKVVLTVDADDAVLVDLIAAVAPDMLQLHGDESPERVDAVRRRFGRPVMRAIAIGAAADLAAVDRYDAVSDALLFDARAPADADRPGGNGRAFDWALLRRVETRHPWLLAGGLDGDNVVAALRTSGARGVDVSSGVETAPGVKDADKIARFVAAVRAARPGPD